MAERLTDERLCWLAVRDELDRKTRGGFRVVLARLSASGRAREAVTDQMSRYGVAVDELAARLSREERETLRTVGQVPAWFLGAVEERSRQLRDAGF